ncbi:methyltransferase, FkbM family [Mucilaginibacter mallensis]|uniref:Methyltransferase, FkbM family n=1 Tax=Mucilaginibacter mallensis TaxID=652787 RepID=A0A1H2B4Q5_MUCMA|nr:FkbM family methyltransferase [Mucilaginibacter mallensis]SDT53168.1 methyltransferase, FkbM family [Mucilaginibacter mallensis]
MGIKLQVGIAIEKSIDKLVQVNYKLLPFIPNGRILPLDLKRALIKPKTIFDIGANIGQTSNYFLKNFPDAEIYSFEPVAATYAQLAANVKSNKIHIYNEGLGAAVSNQTIYINDSSETSSLKDVDGKFSKTEVVKINTAQNFCTQNKIKEIDLLKIDVEGYELEVLDGLGPLLNNVKAIYSEVGFDKNDPNKTYFPDLLERCEKSGFITSGFYDPYRWGNGKLNVFYNVLLINTNLIDI